MSRSIKASLGETHSRTVLKAISWRVIATLTTMTIVYLFTREIKDAFGVGFFDIIAKMSFYYLHERTWGRIAWGKRKHPLSDLPVTRELTPEDREKVEQQLRDLGYLD